MTAYFEDGMSPRLSVAQALAETCLFGGLTDNFKLNRTKVTDKNGKSYWSINFTSHETLHIEIRVYTPGRIQVIWSDDRAKVKGKELFRNEYSAKDYICRAFVLR